MHPMRCCWLSREHFNSGAGVANRESFRVVNVHSNGALTIA